MKKDGGRPTKARGDDGRGFAATFIEPMKAQGVEAPPAGAWHCEIKYDGYRAVAVLNGGRAELWSRNQKPLSAEYSTITAALGKLKCRAAVLDGEVVALDAQGRSRFQLLQGHGNAVSPPRLVYYIFDLLFLDGKSWRAAPIEERRSALAKLLGRRPPAPLQLSPVFLTEPADLMVQAERQGLEGIIAKRPGSSYESGRRSGAWVKCKIRPEQEFVIGGFSPPQRSRPSLGAILVGYYAASKLTYAGKVGSGFSHALLGSLHAQLMRRRVARCPFANLPMARKPRYGQGMTAAEMRKMTWVAPVLVAQVKFAEWTDDGLLRQPVFLGLRKDKAAKEVLREASLAVLPRRATRPA